VGSAVNKYPGFNRKLLSKCKQYLTMFWTILGLTAGFICIASFIPQMLKGYRTKKLDDLSYLLMSFMGSGMLLWILYGIHIDSIPVILTNVMGVCCNVLLLIMKVSYSNQKRTLTNEERT